MNLLAVADQLVSLFLMIFVGFCCAKAGILTPEFRKCLSTLTLSTAAPAVILSSVLESEGIAVSMVTVVITAAAFYALCIALANVFVILTRSRRDQRALDELMLIFTNVGFVGIPVAGAVYGSAGVTMTAVFVLMFNLTFFSYGIVRISGGRGFSPRRLVNPCIIAALLALVLSVTGWHLPGPIEDALSAVGAMNTPLAMLVIGASVAHSDLRAAFTNPRLYRISLLSMFAMPLCVLACLIPVPLDPMLKGVAVLMAAMPVAGNCAMVSDIYLSGDMTASHAVVVSTLMSAVSLPLVAFAIFAAL